MTGIATKRVEGQPAADYRAWVGLAIALGALLRLWQYLGNPSLWLDELALARNIVERSWLGLLHPPLDYAQTAPPGFLLLTKAAIAVFGDSDAVLRLIPLLGGLASLPLFVAISRRALSSKAVPLAVFMFALAPPLVRRAGELKQYSTDVTVALVLLLLGLRWLEKPGSRRALGLGLACALGAWFSQPVAFVGSGVFCALGFWSVLGRRGPALGSLVGPGVLAALGTGAALWYARRGFTPAVREYFYSEWSRGFPPHDLLGVFKWARYILPQPFWREFGFARIVADCFAVLVPVGWLSLGGRMLPSALLIAAPVALTLIASLLRLYPFADRSVIFLVPFGVLAIAAATEAIRERLARIHPLAGVVAAGGVAAAMVSAAVIRRPVIRFEDSRPVLAYVSVHRQPGDPVYVYFTGWLAAERYASRVGLPASDVQIGYCHAHDSAGYWGELERYAGTPRVWLFFTHALGADRRGILARLDSVGVRRDSLVVQQHPPFREPGASAYLYDLSAMLRTSDSTPRSPSQHPICLSAGPHVPVDSSIHAGSRP